MYWTAEPKPVIRRMVEGLGVHHEALRGWIREAEAGAGERDGLLTTESKEELAQPRREVRELGRAYEVLRAASVTPRRIIRATRRLLAGRVTRARRGRAW